MSQIPSKFFQPSARTVQEELNFLKAKISEQSSRCDDIMTQLNEILEVNSKLRDSVRELHVQEEEGNAEHGLLLRQAAELLDSASKMLVDLQTSCQGLLAKTDSVIGGIAGLYQKDFPIDVRFEREYYKDFPVCGSPETPGFRKDFLSLVDGLDKESIEAVVLALQRLKLIRNSGEAAMALYSEEEKLTVRSLIEHFYCNILELSDSCYFYRGYLLPINHFEPLSVEKWCTSATMPQTPSNSVSCPCLFWLQSLYCRKQV